MVRRSGARLNGMPVFVWTFATLVLLHSLAFAVGETKGNLLAEPQLVLPEAEISGEPYSKEWMEDMLAHGEEGKCSPVRLIYEWRNVGWGSNMNRILAEWVRHSIFAGTNNFAVDVSSRFFRHVVCDSVAHEAGKAVEGWECLFKPMPRLCTFSDENEIQEFRDGDGILDEHVKMPKPRSARRDEVATAAALLRFIDSNAQPWFAKEIQDIITTGKVAAMRSGRFVALHVRRGDKLLFEAGKIEIQNYLQAAALHLWESSGDHSGVDSISGIWVSSDDSGVIPEVQQLASSYFPNVATENIFGISFRTPSIAPNLGGDELPTTSNRMNYELYVGLHAELQMLSLADVFVGTFSSNIGRLVYLMRETNGFQRNSTISVDKRDWHIG